jgi:outer membrane protein TolC
MVACQHLAPAPLSTESSAAALEARSLEDPALRELVERTRGHPLPEWPLRRWDLETLTLAALYFEPGLDVARAQWRVAHAGIETAGARPNPVLSVAPERSANPGSGVSPWLAAVTIDWPIETAGKRDHRIARAEALTAAAHRSLSADAWRVRHALRDSLVELAAARARAAALAREAAARDSLAELLAERVRAGAASRADLVPARLAAIQTRAELADAERGRGSALAQVAAAVGVPTRALARVEIDYGLGTGPDLLAGSSEEVARRAALLEREDVLAALDVYAASEAALRLELARQYPDLHLGPGYQFDEGEHKWALGVSLELPVLDRNEGPIAEAVAGRQEAAARFVALQARVLAELEQALEGRRGAREQLDRLEVLASEQGDEVARVRRALALGAVDRLAEVAAEVELRRTQLAVVDARHGLERALSALEAAVQGPLANAGAVEAPPRVAGGEAP